MTSPLPDQMQEARSEIDAGVMTFATELEMAREALQAFSKTSTATIERWVADVNAAGHESWDSVSLGKKTPSGPTLSYRPHADRQGNEIARIHARTP